MRRLPPLSTLRSFEAAARLASFTKAAEELHVTHGAVSRAIATLEDALQIKLFERGIRTVRLTQAGEGYASVVREVLDRLSAATVVLMDQPSSGVLNVSTLDSFAVKWLVPRLFRFAEQSPDIDIRLSTSEKLANFTADGIDLCIRYGRGAYPGVVSELLLKEELTPVMSPGLFAKGPPLNSLSDLRHHNLIHDEFPIDWVTWLRAAGVTGFDARRGIRFQSSVHAVQAAVQGQGVTLGRTALISDELRSGALVRPFQQSLPTDLAYYIVYPPEHLKRPKVRAFRDWLHAEASRTDDSN